MTLTPTRIERLARELVRSTDQHITQAIKWYAPEDKISIRHAIQMQREAQGITLDGAAEVPGRRIGEMDGSYWLRRLNVYGPITQNALEAKMTAAGLTPEIRIEIKCEAIERKWLAPMLGYRLSAMGELATDQLRDNRLASDHVTINYRPEPLSLEMAGLYRRAGLQEHGNYAPHQVDEALAGSDLTPTQRMAIRHSLAMREQVRASGGDVLSERLAALRQWQRQRLSRMV